MSSNWINELIIGPFRPCPDCYEALREDGWCEDCGEDKAEKVIGEIMKKAGVRQAKSLQPAEIEKAMGLPQGSLDPADYTVEYLQSLLRFIESRAYNVQARMLAHDLSQRITLGKVAREKAEQEARHITGMARIGESSPGYVQGLKELYQRCFPFEDPPLPKQLAEQIAEAGGGKIKLETDETGHLVVKVNKAGPAPTTTWIATSKGQHSWAKDLSPAAPKKPSVQERIEGAPRRARIELD